MYVHSTDTKIFNKYHFSCRSSDEAAGLYEHYTFYLHLQQNSSDKKTKQQNKNKTTKNKKQKKQQTIITPVKATLWEFKKDLIQEFF